MDRDFLIELGIDEENANTILDKYTEEIGSIRLKHTVENELMKRGAKSISAAMKLFDTNGLTYANGEVEGLFERLEDFSKENDFLFEESTKRPVFSKKTIPDSGITKAEFEKMGYEKRLKLFKENPEVYKKLTEN